MLCSPAGAHPEGFSGLRVIIFPDRAHAVLTIHTRDMSAWFPPSQNPDYVASVMRKMREKPDELLEVQFDGVPSAPTEVKTDAPEFGLIQVDLDYPIPENAREISIWSNHIVRLPRGHQQLTLFEDPSGNSLSEQTLTGDEDLATCDISRRATFSTTNPSSQPASTQPGKRISFFVLGIEHIVTGYDHLLFLAALLLVCRTFKEAIAVVTFFTVAHSITLSLAALDIVRLPGSIVEPAIAASIVYVGLENIFGKHRFAVRAAVTFGFGLIHGLGFAGALRETGLGSSSAGIVMPLVKFSLGLETGQIAIALVLMQVMLVLRKRPQYEKVWMPVCSVLVSLIGLYWLVTRVFGE